MVEGPSPTETDCMGYSGVCDVHHPKVSRDTLRMPVSHQNSASGEKGTDCLSFSLPCQSIIYKTFRTLPPNALCSMSGRSPVKDSWNGEVKKDAPSASVHQSEEEGLPDSWAFGKPGNTKEKRAFSAVHQCSNRIGSKEMKSS